MATCFWRLAAFRARGDVVDLAVSTVSTCAVNILW